MTTTAQTTTKAQNYQHRQRQEAIATFEDFCFHQAERLRANTRDLARRIRDARHEAAEGPDARMVMTRRGTITTASQPVRREFQDQVSL